jgi:hypothetical protein
MAKPKAKPKAWLWVGAAGALVLLYLYYRSRSAAPTAAAASGSGTPGPDRTGSAAQQPSGGASTIPGNLPPLLVGQPADTPTQAVAAADTSSTESPSLLTPIVPDVPTQPVAPPVLTPAVSAVSSLLGTPTPLIPMPGTFAAVTQTPIYQSNTVGTSGLVGTGTATTLVDQSGHVVNAKGARVGGAVLDL